MNIPPHKENGFFLLHLEDDILHVPRYCPHRAGRLDHGHVNRQRKTLTCPLHHSVFCLRTGAHLSGPDCGPLALQRPASTGLQAGSAEMQSPLATMPDS